MLLTLPDRVHFEGSMGQFADSWVQENSSAVEHKTQWLALRFNVQENVI
jgi:hypothetical protein